MRSQVRSMVQILKSGPLRETHDDHPRGAIRSRGFLADLRKHRLNASAAGTSRRRFLGSSVVAAGCLASLLAGWQALQADQPWSDGLPWTDDTGWID